MWLTVCGKFACSFSQTTQPTLPIAIQCKYILRVKVQWSSLENGFPHLNLSFSFSKNSIGWNTLLISFGSKWAPILSWSTAAEFLKIHQAKVEILHFEANKFCLFLPVFTEKCWKTGSNKQNLLALKCNISTLAWWIFKNSKAVVQERLGAHSKPK